MASRFSEHAPVAGTGVHRSEMIGLLGLTYASLARYCPYVYPPKLVTRTRFLLQGSIFIGALFPLALDQAIFCSETRLLPLIQAHHTGYCEP